MKKRILLFVPDGVGIRNYLYSDVFKHEQFEVVLLHDFPKIVIDDLALDLPIKSEIRVPSYREGIVEKFLRELIHRVRIIRNVRTQDNPSIYRFWKRSGSGLTHRIFYGLIKGIAPLIRTYNGVLGLERRYTKSVKANSGYQAIKRQIEELSVDQVFCTHQRAIKATPVMLAARELGLKTSTVIYSWDNLPKARLPFRADTYFLWSEVMVEHMQVFYPEIPREKLVISGSPQFEFYQNSEIIIDRELFFRQNGLDPDRRIICFSGDDVRTSPYDPDYLRDLAQQVTDSGLNSEFQILLRRCPVDLSGRYQDVVSQFPDLIVEVPPKWREDVKEWSAVYPEKVDVGLLTNLAYHADVVVNLGSTMAFDFGMFNKPCIFINYDQPHAQNWSVKAIYQYEHFRSMPAEDCVWWWNDKNGIIQLLNKVKAGDSTKIYNWYQVINTPGASENIQKALLA